MLSFGVWLTTLLTSNQLLEPSTGSKDSLHRIRTYNKWLKATGRRWIDTDLAQYRDYLLARKLSPISVTAHLGSLRGLFRAYLMLYEFFADESGFDPRELPADAPNIDQVIEHLQLLLDPDHARVIGKSWRDLPEKDRLRMWRTHINTLLTQMGTDNLVGLRDRAIVVLMLNTGLREAELCELDVADLNKGTPDQPVLRIPPTEDNPVRYVPYDKAVSLTVNAWLKAARIVDGAVFRSFYNGNVLFRGRLSIRGLLDILNRYPMVINGRPVELTPGDLRRTYAFQQYLAGYEIPDIQQWLGHSSREYTERLIGDLDMPVAEREAARMDWNAVLGERHD